MPGNPGASRFAERLPGRQVVAELAGADGNIQVTLRGILRDGSRYLRRSSVLRRGKSKSLLRESCCWIPRCQCTPTGTVDGSPVVTETAFFGVEHPSPLIVRDGLRALLPATRHGAVGRR